MTRGRESYLALGDWNAVCYICGFRYKAGEMKQNWQGFYVCERDWEPRQPQDFVRGIPDVQTPPWVQPRPGATFVSGGQTTIYVTESASSSVLTFTPTETITPTTSAPVYISNPDGIYPVATDVTLTDGVEVILLLQDLAALGVGTGIGWGWSYAISGASLVVAEVGSGSNHYVYYLAGSTGSCTPDNFTLDGDYTQIFSVQSGVTPSYAGGVSVLQLEAPIGPISSSMIRAVTINGLTLNTSAAVYSLPSATRPTWTWGGYLWIAKDAPGTYTLSITL